MTLEDWVRDHGFWKLDQSDWEGIWVMLKAAGFPDAAIGELLDRIIGMVASEYGE